MEISDMITNLHHVAILTSDMEKAVEYYTELLGCEPPEPVRIDKPGMRLRSALLPVGSDKATFLQILEPEVGPGVKELAEGGEGTLFEMAFQVDDAENFADRMIERGAPPSDIAEQPVDGKYIVSKFGNKYFILPGSKMHGTRIEIVEMVHSAK
jgi:catechol 2,3-dioxygenase-like lactoylglutathione lyase family enzyme